MTSDAKIGLLLGLVFIFIIAFLINGLPNFSRADSDNNNNELTTKMVWPKKISPGIAANERKVNTDIVKRKVRYQTELPKKVAGSQQISGQIEKITISVVKTEPVINKKKIETIEPVLPKIYIVEDGDSLSVIAKKVYGDDAGNKLVNITRIVKANRNLKSPDEISVGQKLLIPPLSTMGTEKNHTSYAMSSGKTFKKVEALARKNLVESNNKKKSRRWYLVRDGDSLWEIASKNLGDGNRYDEISRLNSNILSDEDTLVVGMRLKLPAR